MNKRLLATAALLATPLAAQALEPAHVDGYYQPWTNLEVDVPHADDADVDGDGWGAKAFVPIGQPQNFVITGEYETSSYDDDFDVDEFRVGGGYQMQLGQTDALTGGLFAEYVNYDLDGEDADGYGVHLRLHGKAADIVALYGSVGYVSLSGDHDLDFDGFEYLVGASVDVTPQIGLFAEFRESKLEGDNDLDLTADEVRTGVRFVFSTRG